MSDQRRAHLDAKAAHATVAKAAHASGRPDPVDSHRTTGSHEHEGSHVLGSSPSVKTGRPKATNSRMSDRRWADLDARQRAKADHASGRPDPEESHVVAPVGSSTFDFERIFEECIAKMTGPVSS